MKGNSFMFGRILIIAALVFAAAAQSQDYPGKPVRMVVPFPPGGGVDTMARMVSEKLQTQWGQTVIVENRSGAGGNIGMEHVARAAPDGYTLLFSPPGPLAINKQLYAKLSFDPEALAPVSLVAVTPGVLLVNPSLPATNVQQLIAVAKADPDRLSYASQGTGNIGHLAAELFKSMAGVSIVHVPYKGAAPALADLAGGQVQLMFSEYGVASPFIRAGRLRVIAVTTEKRHAFLPDVPTVAEVLPGFVSVTWFAVVAPPGTPSAMTAKVSATIAEALKMPDVAKRLTDLSIEPVGSTPAELAVYMAQDRERWAKVIRATGAKAD
jgi:tripartite-type tricarboxylate transporter receptor subunit TctC